MPKKPALPEGIYIKWGRFEAAISGRLAMLTAVVIATMVMTARKFGWW